MANVDNPHGFVPFRRLGGGALEVWHGLTASNTAFVPGDVLKGESGYVAIAGATTDAILGIADGTQTSSGTHSDVHFYPALGDYAFTAQCSGTPTQATIWTFVDFEGTTGSQEINEDASTVDHLRVIGLKDNSSMGLNAELIVTWNTSMWAQTACA